MYLMHYNPLASFSDRHTNICVDINALNVFYALSTKANKHTAFLNSYVMTHSIPVPLTPESYYDLLTSAVAHLTTLFSSARDNLLITRTLEYFKYFSIQSNFNTLH